MSCSYSKSKGKLESKTAKSLSDGNLGNANVGGNLGVLARLEQGDRA